MDARRILSAALVSGFLSLLAGCGASTGHGTGYGGYGGRAAPVESASQKETTAAQAPGSKVVQARSPQPETAQPKVAPIRTATSRTEKPKTDKPKSSSEKTVARAPAPKPAARTEVKPAAPSTPVAAGEESPAPAVAVSLDKLPLTIDGEWVLNRTETRCSLASTPLKMDDGQGGTEVSLLLEPGQLLIHTRSSIDLSYTDTGVTVGDSRFPLETVVNDTDLSFSKQRAALLAAMGSGDDLTLTVGFWPTWPVTHTYSIAISLRHFAPAMQAWETCNRLLRGN